MAAANAVRVERDRQAERILRSIGLEVPSPANERYAVTVQRVRLWADVFRLYMELNGHRIP